MKLVTCPLVSRKLAPFAGGCLGLLAVGAVAPFAPDLILPGSLPNVDFQVRFKQYSGFLDASATHKFHYWLTESQGPSPSTDPLILWLRRHTFRGQLQVDR